MKHQTPNSKHQLSIATSSEVKRVFKAETRNLFEKIETQLRGFKSIVGEGRELIDILNINERDRHKM
jgi:hypothetical protein